MFSLYLFFLAPKRTLIGLVTLLVCYLNWRAVKLTIYLKYRKYHMPCYHKHRQCVSKSQILNSVSSFSFSAKRTVICFTSRIDMVTLWEIGQINHVSPIPLVSHVLKLSFKFQLQCQTYLYQFHKPYHYDNSAGDRSN